MQTIPSFQSRSTIIGFRDIISCWLFEKPTIKKSSADFSPYYSHTNLVTAHQGGAAYSKDQELLAIFLDLQTYLKTSEMAPNFHNPRTALLLYRVPLSWFRNGQAQIVNQIAQSEYKVDTSVIGIKGGRYGTHVMVCDEYQQVLRNFWQPRDSTDVYFYSSRDYGGAGAEKSRDQALVSRDQYVFSVGLNSSTGLVAYCQQVPLPLGGFYSIVPPQEMVLKPNAGNYVYFERDQKEKSKVNIKLFTAKQTLSEQ